MPIGDWRLTIGRLAIAGLAIAGFATAGLAETVRAQAPAAPAASAVAAATLKATIRMSIAKIDAPPLREGEKPSPYGNFGPLLSQLLTPEGPVAIRHAPTSRGGSPRCRKAASSSSAWATRRSAC